MRLPLTSSHGQHRSYLAFTQLHSLSGTGQLANVRTLLVVGESTLMSDRSVFRRAHGAIASQWHLGEFN